MKNSTYTLKLGLIFLSFLIVNSCNSQHKKTPEENKKVDINTQIGDYVIGLFEDSKGNLWFGTLSKGVAKYDGKQLKYYTTNDGLKSNRVGSIVEDKDGNLWLATHSGISKYDGKTFKNFTEEDGLCSNSVSNLLLDKTGTLWIGTWAGICTFDGTNFQKFSIPNPDIEIPIYQETTNWSTQIIEDSKGNIWFSRDGYGVCKYDGKTFTHFTKKDGLAANTVQDIQEDKEGNIWFASRVAEKDHPDANKRFGAGGLVKYDGKTFTSFPHLKGLSNSDVFQIYKDPKDNIWIGTINQGIYKYDGKQFTNYSRNKTENRFSKAVVDLLEDSKGNIWIACAGGLFRLDTDGIILNVTTNGPWF